MGDGAILFQGKASDAKNFLAEQGYKLPRFGNPADYFMKILTFSYPKTEEDVTRFQSLRINYDKVRRREIEEENMRIKCPELDVKINKKTAMAPFKTQLV